MVDVDVNMGMDMDTGPFTFNRDAHADAGIGPVPVPASAAKKTNGTRLRASCDACQSLKVKCSQDKPSCGRCSRIGLGCVYSPLRRMGRPKKRASAAPSAASSSPPTDAATPASQSRLHDGQRRRHGATTATITTPSPASLIPRQLAGHDPDGMGNGFGAGISFRRENGGLVVNGTHRGGMVSGAEDDALAGLFPATELEDRPMTTPFPKDGSLSPSTRLDGPSASTRQQPRLPTSPLAALLGLDSQAGTQGEQSPAADDGGQTETPAGSCYLAVLQRLTRLEATLATGPRPPRLDVILSAERDTRALKDRISACRSHDRRNSETASSPKAPGDRSCADTHGPALVVLALLADRVTALLEDLFRRAALSSHAVDQAARGAAAVWLHGPPPPADILSPAAERRYERSVRASLPRGISCPVPEADCALAVGGYEIDDGEVKGRAVRRILGRRVGALGAMLGDLGGYLAGEGDGRVPEGEEGSSVLLGSFEGSRGVGRAAAAHMVDDLCKRVEMLRGRIELAGH